ncbi:tRNA (cytidine(34)-2'-O)-methyltransferase [Agrobacterium larrymoorei]|uniref:tRNA (cytidine(34)-2'-O)-methyltransferase n=1 Tax=Agrobacterium larrymoorei TaxID=160699 RepID=A0AAJ2BAZ0_9HYPH|nr:tRNA (cytidine(34)-2'-O)-methyltransferase [Agrobacterium larrymoorei]MDQ1186628.1 tRNA (cytidine/uridine-2'-O-)-methyltransferase [Agrobacterium larrymoorei]MDR6102901.1 tRNA (cytidine/uridine-2'-O-)-methyltransferase [Agrobacterium larrymoorei]
MSNIRIALYQPDIPGNTGTILRLAACLGVSVDIIEPAGFDISDRNLKRAGMDYIAAAALTRHVNWDRFEAWRATTGRRLVLASTKAALPYTKIAYRPDDILLFGRESAGVPDHVHDKADERVLIPMVEGQRSINVAMSAAMITGEVLRQTFWP